MKSVVIPAILIVFLSLVAVLIINISKDIDVADGDRLIFGAIGISGFMLAILTPQEDKHDFILG